MNNSIEFLCQNLTKQSIKTLLDSNVVYKQQYDLIKNIVDKIPEQKFYVYMYEYAINPNKPPIELKVVIDGIENEEDTEVYIQTKSGITKDIIKPKVVKDKVYTPKYTQEEYDKCKSILKIGKFNSIEEQCHWLEVEQDLTYHKRMINKIKV